MNADLGRQARPPSHTASAPDGGARIDARTSAPILQVRDLRTYFFSKRGIGKAVDGVSFDLAAGETLGLVGESGSGKSLTALSILGLNPRPASRVVGGTVLFDGQDLLKLSDREMRKYRGGRISLVLQDPMTALNPVLSVGSQIYEPLRLHRRLTGHSLRDAAIELLRSFRIPDASTRLEGYPHESSGGMRQRIVSAIALSGGPDVLIADEPTTALDATIQLAYLELLRQVQRESKLAILFITHDLGVVARMCDRVSVMYAGRIVETAPTRILFDRPGHPYTQALIDSVPDVRASVVSGTRLRSIEGQPPSIFDVPVGCAFADRCAYTQARCRELFPPLTRLSTVHSVNCWRHEP